MKKFISILSAILLVIAFSIPCGSEDATAGEKPIKIKAKNTVKFKPGKKVKQEKPIKIKAKNTVKFKEKKEKNKD